MRCTAMLGSTALRLGGLGSRPLATRMAAAVPRHSRPVTRCSKGFGTDQAPRKISQDDVPVEGQGGGGQRRLKFKGKKQMRSGVQPTTPAQQQFARSVEEAPEAQESLMETLEFEARLKALKAESDQKRQAVAQRSAAEAGGGSILDAGPLGGPLGGAIDYDRPPPLAKTLFDKGDSTSKEYEGVAMGPSQVGLAAAAVALAGIFILSSGIFDFGGGSRRSSPPPAVQAEQQLSDEQRRDLETQLAATTSQLEASPEDPDALEAAAVVNARLGKFGESVALLQRLAPLKPGDVDVWRVLGEAQLAQGQGAAAVAAYQKAWELSKQGSLEVLQGLVAAQVAAGQEEAAVELLKAAQPGGELGAIELQLLLGKTYAQWKNHIGNALEVYEGLIESNPDDFRGYLAKGILLRQQGRLGDAQRSFLQAKFHAPKEQRAVVEAFIAK